MKYSVQLEETIMQKGIPGAAGSKMLENFIAVFDATVVTLLMSADIKITGRLSFGEFGAPGLFSDQCDALTAAVSSFANSSADAVLCNDYTGAICTEAGRQGLYYIHPAYGTVSRYGLIPAVTSIDQIGILCKDKKTGFEIFDIIKQEDSQPCVRGQTLSCVPMTHACPQPYYDVYPQIMQILCCGELANNISRYDGIKFGYRAKDYSSLDELYTKSRTEAFGEDIKLAALIGAMVLSEDNYMPYYDKAMRLRRLIKNSLDFSDCDVITATAEQTSSFPALSRLCGLPSLTTPSATYIANSECEDLLRYDL
ncbi:MAG: amidase family protein [Oscillospiraceae bacterium]|nr:amidase family protein [Oscillospiraceae bacterium]